MFLICGYLQCMTTEGGPQDLQSMRYDIKLMHSHKKTWLWGARWVRNLAYHLLTGQQPPEREALAAAVRPLQGKGRTLLQQGLWE